MMNKIFKKEIGETLEVYMEIWLWSLSTKIYMANILIENFKSFDNTTWGSTKKVYLRGQRQHILRGYLIERGIEDKLEMCEAIIKMNMPSTKMEIMKLKRMLMVLNWFITKLAQHALPLYSLLRKDAQFHWTLKCE